MPDVETPTAEETPKVDSPQEKVNGQDGGAEPTPSEPEKKVEKKEPETPEPPVVELKGFERLEDGRVKLTIGGSTYFGKDVDEAWANAEKGINEKNKSYQQTQEELRKLKAKSSIREPDDEEIEGDLPPQPKPEQYLRTVFTERGLDPKMMSWSDAQWDEYQEREGLKDRHIVKLQNDMEAARQEAMRRFYDEETKWFNLSLLKREVTPAVRDMVVDAGLDPEEFGDIYLEVLKEPSSRYKSGEFNQTAILRSVNKKIVEKLRGQKTEGTELQKAKEQLNKELEEKKKALRAGASRTDQKPQKNEKPVVNLRDSFERMRNLRIETGKL